MADSRIRNLANELNATQVQTLLNSLYLAVDDVSLSDTAKILFKTLLTEAVVTASTNNYQAMTPKAFYDSVMTTTRRGIGQLSTDAAVTAKSGTGLLNAVHQTLMQAQWLKDWTKDNSSPVFWKKPADGYTRVPFAYQTVMDITAGDSGFYSLKPSGLNTIYAVKVSMVGYGAGSSPILFSTVNMIYDSVTKSTQLLDANGAATGFYLRLLANGSDLGIYMGIPGSKSISFSFTVNGVAASYTA